VQKIL